MISAHATHPGLVRQNNEDCIRTDDNLGIYVLADGIGGHYAGEVASALAVETVYAVLRSNIAHTAVDGFFELMVYAIHAAHWEIITKVQPATSLKKMGTTLVVAVVRENRAYIVHAGDSRCYLFRGNPPPGSVIPDVTQNMAEGEGHDFNQLTRDHTVGDHLLASGFSKGQIAKRQFHTLTQSVGCGNPPTPDFTTADISQGDLLLICSDGLTDMLSDVEIEAILAQGDASLDARAAALIDAANAHGGRDNISVVLVASPDPEPDQCSQSD